MNITKNSNPYHILRSVRHLQETKTTIYGDSGSKKRIRITTTDDVISSSTMDDS